MLTIVACAQYQMKQKAKLKVKTLLQQQQSHTQPAGKSSNGVHSTGHSHNSTHTDQVISRTSPRQQARKSMGGRTGNTIEDRDREHLPPHPNRLHGHTD